MLQNILLILAGYLIGSIASAILIGRLLGTADPRTQGSGNPGATNMLRVGGKKAAVLTLVGDMVKGIIPVLIAKALGASPETQAAVALAAFLGHLYPVFFGFKGGKGVATALGTMLGLYWLVGLAAIGTWLLVALIFRISSLSALIAVLAVPFYFWWLKPEPAFITAMAIMGTLLYWRHRSNIRNIIKGTEEKIGQGI